MTEAGGARERVAVISGTGFTPPVRAVRSTPLEGLTTTDRRTVMIEFDTRPLQPFARIFAACPDYGELQRHFWSDWGPIFPPGRPHGRERVVVPPPGALATRPTVAPPRVRRAGPRGERFPG